MIHKLESGFHNTSLEKSDGSINNADLGLSSIIELTDSSDGESLNSSGDSSVVLLKVLKSKRVRLESVLRVFIELRLNGVLNISFDNVELGILEMLLFTLSHRDLGFDDRTEESKGCGLVGKVVHLVSEVHGPRVTELLERVLGGSHEMFPIFIHESLVEDTGDVLSKCLPVLGHVHEGHAFGAPASGVLEHLNVHVTSDGNLGVKILEVLLRDGEKPHITIEDDTEEIFSLGLLGGLLSERVEVGLLVGDVLLLDGHVVFVTEREVDSLFFVKGFSFAHEVKIYLFSPSTESNL